MCDSIWVSLHFSLDGQILGYPLYRARIPNGTRIRIRDEPRTSRRPTVETGRLDPPRPPGPPWDAVDVWSGGGVGDCRLATHCDSGVSMITNHVMSRVGDGVAALWLSSHVTDTR